MKSRYYQWLLWQQDSIFSLCINKVYLRSVASGQAGVGRPGPGSDKYPL